ncbi:MAG TPA: hypothetical protein VF212_11925 [Longimicrobiales bacterium]
MAIRIPSLDDRTYEQLLDVLRRQIPPGAWTDHNASDPGIMLLELFCWLGEMALYRMDQVPPSHRQKFLDFLIDPPEPVTVEVEFEVEFTDPAGPESVTIDAGTQLATDYVDGRRHVFETFRPLEIRRPAVGIKASGTTTARAILEVTNEPLGVSDGTPDQTFTLRPPRAALGLAADEPAPLLTDFVHRTAGYEPNPLVRVGGAIWTPVASLRTGASRATPSGAPHYAVEPSEMRIRFGDGTFGAIPPEGTLIECVRYRLLEGPVALTVREGDVRHVLNYVPPPGIRVVNVSNGDAEGGENFFPPDRREELGLARFRAPYRLVTERDFERAALEDFNAFQRLSNHQPEIARTAVVFNRRPPSPPELGLDVDAPGYVTLVLLPGAPHFDEAVFQDETVPRATKEAMVALPPGLWERLKRFLDRRRLITTRLVERAPTLQAFSIDATVAIENHRNVADMEQALRKRVYGFLSLLTGGADGRGWPLGRHVYRSQLYRLLEDADGVDHVASLHLTPADAEGNVALGPYDLPLLERLTLALIRA